MTLLNDDYRHQGMRKHLVQTIKQGPGKVSDEAVLRAMGAVPRHLFIDDSAFLSLAYADQAFPIGCGQTISQPTTVAVQSQLLRVEPGMKVLEIGTGSGYQTAVLCELGAKVFSIERHKPLFETTKQRLVRLGYKATLMHGDGYKGAPLHGPFDRIIVTCGAPEVPEALLGQLKLGGILVIPVGPDGRQKMWSWSKIGADVFDRQEHGSFSFVPMLAHKVRG